MCPCSSGVVRRLAQWLPGPGSQRVTTERQAGRPHWPRLSERGPEARLSVAASGAGLQHWGGWWLSGLTSGCISRQKDEPVESHIPLEKPKNTSRGKAGRNVA